jgi:hypothetical protein
MTFSSVGTAGGFLAGTEIQVNAHYNDNAAPTKIGVLNL